MQATGAVLERSGDARPYASSRPLTVGEVTLDDPRPHEILVEVEVAGICHSDLSVVDGNRARPLPMLLGHEASGRVLQAGDAVSRVSVGQQVVMTFMPRCGVCAGCATEGRRPCVPGTTSNEAGALLEGGFRISRHGEPVHHHLGVSGFATHAVVDERSVVPVDDDVPAEIAALLGCAVLTGGGAVRNVAAPQPGQTVAVVGLGGVGMAALLTALATDGVTVVGVDVSADKLRRATELGAHEVLDPAAATERGFTADLVVEAGGHVRAFETAVRLTGAGGTTVTVGLPPATATAAVSPTFLVGGGRSVVGSYLGSAVPSRDVPAYLALWRAGQLPLEALVSSHLTLDQINTGMDRLADGTELRELVDLRA